MSDRKLTLEIEVDDNGSARVKKFSGNLSKEFKKAEKASGRFSRASARHMDSIIGRTTKLVAGVAAVAGAYGLGRLGMNFVRIASQFETLGISLETVTGSSEKARQSLAWIQEFTKKTPYELGEVANSFRKLAAYGLDPVKYLKVLGDTASGMGKTLNDAVEMFADAATGEFERLKEFGIRASQQNDKVVFKWMQNGKQMVLEAEKTQTGITRALGKVFTRFEGGMEKQSKTWGGMMSNLSDTWTMFGKEVMESGPFEVMKQQLNSFLDHLSSSEGQMDLAKWADQTARSVLNSFLAMSYGAQLFLNILSGIQQMHGWIMEGWSWIQSKDIASTLGLYESKHPREGLRGLFKQEKNKLQGKTIPQGLQEDLKKQTESIEKWKEYRVEAQNMFENAVASTEALRSLIKEMLNASPNKKVFGGGSDNKPLSFGKGDPITDQKGILSYAEKIKAGVMQQVIDLSAESNLKHTEMIDEWTHGWETGFGRMENLAYDTANAMTGAFSEFFFDVLDGELKSFGDYLV